MRRLTLYSRMFLICLAFYLAPASLALGDDGCAAAGCHAPIVTGKNVHPAVESCDTCHDSIETTHPQAGKKTFRLTNKQPELCFSCHDTFGTGKYIHAPVQEECTTCHNPHSSDLDKLMTASLPELCATCHSEQTEAAHLHGPVSAGDCLVCHTPHESDRKSLVVKEGQELCMDCHEDMSASLKKSKVHSALDAGCVSCHDPHGSPYPRMLPSAGAEFCLECHSEISDTLAKATTIHTPLRGERRCGSCHEPHASDSQRLLLKPGKELCLECHPKVVSPSMTVVHGPIRDGECTACHEPHASSDTKLLSKSYPSDIYVPYSDAAYELCFSCHNRDLVRYPDTSFATNFRNGEKNLHFLHVNKKEKGRSCGMCHAPHGSERPKLILNTVSFGRWEFSLNFTKLEAGGSCAPGCHRPYTYDWKKQAGIESPLR